MDTTRLQLSGLILFLKISLFATDESTPQQNVPSTTPPLVAPDFNPDYLSSTCRPGICRNGLCYMRGSEPHCSCQSLFKGPRCEIVDLAMITYSVIGSTVIIQWPRPPRLTGYSFVYYELDKSDSYVYKRDILLKDSDSAALVGNLKGGYTTYRVCVEDESLADRIVDRSDILHLRNCINVTTQPDFHTLAAWCIAAMLVCVIVLLIYWQKDKFELLYFSKPALLMYEAQEEKDNDSSKKRADSPSMLNSRIEPPESQMSKQSILLRSGLTKKA